MKPHLDPTIKKELSRFKQIKKERNPGIVKALNNAVKEMNSKCFSPMFVYIDGDYILMKCICLN